MLFDAHAHYDDRRFEAEFDGGFRGAIAKAIDEGVGHIVNVGSSVRTSRNSIALAEEYPLIYAAVGIHPSDAQEIPAADCDKALYEIEKLCAHEKVRAVGEIGYDYHYDGTDKERQTYFFRAQLEIARRVSLPVIIHSRDAAGDTFDMIKSATGVSRSNTQLQRKRGNGGAIRKARMVSLLLGSPDIQKLTRSKRKRGCGSGRQDSHRDGLPLPATDTSPRRDKLFGISEIHLRRSCRNTRYHI